MDRFPSGKASDVQIDANFSRWILGTIRKLRSKFLVLLGLWGEIKKDRSLKQAIERAFDGFNLKAAKEIPFNRYKFREWDVEGLGGDKIKMVFWPNHPSRHPFSDSEIWKSACDEFANRHKRLLLP